MPNIALQLEYNGSNFSGFQKQLNARTIQAELELALSRFANQDIQVVTAGRTDSGVHALSQVVNFTSESKRELHGWVRGVNALLPRDISILNAAIVPDNFNARFDAVSRTYYYYLWLRPSRLAVFSRQFGWYHAELDIENMQEACEQLIGRHDFSSFRAANCQANTPVREMYQAEIKVYNTDMWPLSNCSDQASIPESSIMLRFRFTANAFLYHMVRNLVGALVYVGNGRLTIDQFADLFQGRDRRYAPPTFMPDGLYLAQVNYNYNLFE